MYLQSAQAHTAFVPFTQCNEIHYIIHFRVPCTYSTMETVEFAKLAFHRTPSRGWQNDPVACLYPRIYIGAGCQFTPELAQKGNFTHVINCATKEDGPEWFSQAHPDKYAILNAVDSVDVNILNWYPLFERVMFNFLRDPGSRNIYVHCQCGINRSAYLALAFVCRTFGFQLKTLAHSLVAQRPCTLSNPSFWRQVSDFVKTPA
jgi:predicted protein tyrosine phosphatase